MGVHEDVGGSVWVFASVCVTVGVCLCVTGSPPQRPQPDGLPWVTEHADFPASRNAEHRRVSVRDSGGEERGAKG